MSAFNVRRRGPTHPPEAPSAPRVGVTAARNSTRPLAMKIEHFAGHHEAKDALVLSISDRHHEPC